MSPGRALDHLPSPPGVRPGERPAASPASDRNARQPGLGGDVCLSAYTDGPGAVRARTRAARRRDIRPPSSASTRSANRANSTWPSLPSGMWRSNSCRSYARPRHQRGWSSTRSTSTFCARCETRLRLDARQAGGQLESRASWVSGGGKSAPTASSDAVLTVSAKEAALINDLTGSSDLALHLPDTEELPRSAVRIRQRRGILFLGNFLHAPNRDAAAYLCQEIVPRLDPELLAEHEIFIVGTAAEEKIQDLAEGLRHVRVVGWVPSVLPYLKTPRECR